MLVRIKTTRYQEICLLIDILFIRKQCSKECNRSTINLTFLDNAKELVLRTLADQSPESFARELDLHVWRLVSSRRMDARHCPI